MHRSTSSTVLICYPTLGTLDANKKKTPRIGVLKTKTIHREKNNTSTTTILHKINQTRRSENRWYVSIHRSTCYPFDLCYPTLGIGVYTPNLKTMTIPREKNNTTVLLNKINRTCRSDPWLIIDGSDSWKKLKERTGWRTLTCCDSIDRPVPWMPETASPPVHSS
jgi:hypothetical protein